MHRHRTDRPLRFHCGLERTELERPDARDRREGSLRINSHGLAFAQRRVHFLGLADARLRIAAIETKLPGAANDLAHHWHRKRFTFRDEAYVIRQHRQCDENIYVARMIRRKNPRPGFPELVQNFAALYAK